MSKLVFKAEDVKGMMEHVINTEGAKITLAHDEGVYLLSQGFTVGDSSVIAYAQGCNPKTDADWYDTAHALVGGDDFVEYLDADFAKAVLEQIEADCDEFTILITSNSIKLGKPKKAKPTSLTLVPEPESTDTPPELTPTNESQSEDKQDKPEVTEVQNDSQPEEKQDEPEPKAEEIQLKPAQAIKQRFTELVSQGLITDEVINTLTDKAGTAKAFKVRYAFLKEFDSNVPIKELTYVSGCPRYYSKAFTVNGKEYLMCNDTYKKTVPCFMEWADSLSK